MANWEAFSVIVHTTGRTDIEAFFQESGIRESRKLVHHPCIVFLENGPDVEVRLIDRAVILLDFPDETKVMAQWGGKWRSDFFQFTVGQFRAHLEAHPKESYQMV